MRVTRMKVTRAEFIVGIKVDRRARCFNPILYTRAVAALSEVVIRRCCHTVNRKLTNAFDGIS
jgi:hypothetical protein